MLNKNEVILVNEVVKALDNTVEVIADSNSITIVERDATLNEVFNDKIKFIDEIKELVKLDMIGNCHDIEKNEGNRIYNRVKQYKI